jgi:hypothetical protein
MAEVLTGDERRALELLRDDGYDRFKGAEWWVRDDLLDRGLVLVAGSRTGEHYWITGRGREALDPPRPG